MVVSNIYYHIFIIVYFYLLILNKLCLFIGIILFIYLSTYLLCDSSSYLGGESLLDIKSYLSSNGNGFIINNSKYIFIFGFILLF